MRSNIYNNVDPSLALMLKVNRKGPIESTEVALWNQNVTTIN